MYLTQEGKKYVSLIKEIFLDVETEVLKDLSKEEMEVFITIFTKICGKMTDMEGLQ